MAYSEKETELEARLSECITPVGLYSKKVTLIIEVYTNGGCCQIPIGESDTVEKVKEKLEKYIRIYLDDIYNIKNFTLDLSACMSSYLLSNFDRNWIEDPFWKRRFINLNPIYLKSLD